MIDADIMLDIHKDADDVVLPGSYEAGPKESGTEHSRQKLVLAAQDLQPHLSSGSSSSPVIIQSLPCTNETETWSYRCKCTFQIMAVGSVAGEDPTTNTTSYDEYVYAMRTQGQAVPLGSSRFPIATRRIQTAMQQLSDLVFFPSNNNPQQPYSAIRQGLTSVTFSSSWCDTPEADCIVTLMYGRPLVADEQQQWRNQASGLCQALGLRQLYGSAKKTLLAALDPSSSNTSTLRDSVYLQWDSSSNSSDWTVILTAPLPSPMTNSSIHVKYEKPYNAFYHPNANAMKHALQWMLQRLTWIRQATGGDVGDTSVPPPKRRLNLLELYCGCGAHTVALAKSGVLQNILAIELDPRLIRACHNNVQLNGLNDDDDDSSSSSSSSCGVQIIQGDAGTWAKHSYKWTTQHYTILLVDPPRAGLDPAVCDMATGMQGSSSRFEHVLYISCGHAALLRDLERLSDSFEIVHLCQLDLFPRTDSIETLVHLQRKVTF